MNFLKYIELSAENLQFYLWFRDYSERFNKLPESEKVLSPEWTGEKSAQVEAKTGPKHVNAEAAAILKGTDFASDTKIAESEKGSSNPFFTPPRTPTSVHRREESLDSYDESMTTGKVNHTQRAAGAFENAGLKWKPREFY
jgi:hypothetical protein